MTQLVLWSQMAASLLVHLLLVVRCLRPQLLLPHRGLHLSAAAAAAAVALAA
jgi:hypothetical protein